MWQQKNYPWKVINVQRDLFVIYKISILFRDEMSLSALTGIRKVLLAHKKNSFKKHPCIKLYKSVLPWFFFLAEYSYIN